MVATPHVSDAYLDTVARDVAACATALQEAADAAGIDICLLAGAEVELLHREGLTKDDLVQLRLGTGPFTLVELPFSADARFAEMLLGMHGDLRPMVIAHPERCRAFHDDRELLGHLVEDGMLVVQVTAASVAGSYGSTVKATAWSKLEQGLVHVIASDAHDATRRPPLLREPLLAAGLEAKLIATLCDDGPAAILAGESPPPAQPVTSPRARRLRRLHRRWRKR